MKTAKVKKSSASLRHSRQALFFKKNNSNDFFHGNGPATSKKSFFSNSIQAKLKIGRPNDKYEQEADSMAEKVVQKSGVTKSSLPIQSKYEANDREEKLQKMEENGEEIEIMRKPIFESDEGSPNDLIQIKRDTGSRFSTSPYLESQLYSSKGLGQPINKDTRNEMESAFGTDFKNVKVHTDSEAIQMNKDLGAKAFTHGSDIYFGKGMYDPTSKNGKHLIAHEVTHVVQQTNPPQSIKKDDTIISDDSVMGKTNDIQRFIGSNMLQLSPLSDELDLIWASGDKSAFFNRLRNLGQSDPDVLTFIESTLSGDDLWLAKNLFNYAEEANWPIHLRVEREMKGWPDSKGKAEVFKILRTADGASATDGQLTASLQRLFLPGTDDIWYATNLQKYGSEKKWPITAFSPALSFKQVKFSGGHALSSYGGDPKKNPIWSPGAIDHASSFTKATTPSINAILNVGKGVPVASIPSLSIRIKEGTNIRGTSKTAVGPGPKELQTPGLSAKGLSESSGVKQKTYSLIWEASVDGKTWASLGTSGPHLIYWIHDSPKTAPLYNFAVDKATGFATGAADVPAAIRKGLRSALSYDPADPINADPLSVFADGVGICTDFGNLLTHLAQSVGYTSNAVMFWGGFQTLGKNIWATMTGSYINLINVKSPNPAYNPPTNPAGWAFNYHVISRIAGTLHDAALDRTGIDAKAVHDGKIVHFVELAGTALPPAKKGTAYSHTIARKDHLVKVTIRDYGSKITSGDFSSIIPIHIPATAASPVRFPVTWLPNGVALPAGLTLDPAMGIISGSPTVDGTFTIPIKVIAGATGLENPVSLTLLINP